MFRSIACLFLGALVAGGGFFFFGRDTHDADWWTLECEKEELKGQLEICQVRLEAKAGSPDEMKIRNAKQTVDRNAVRLAGMRERAMELRTSVATTVSELASLRETRVQDLRRLALGKEWAEFSSRDGRRYEQVKVVAIYDGGVTLRHIHGSVTVRYADLSDEQRVIFGLDEHASLAAQAVEDRNTAAYHDWVDKEKEEADLRETVELAREYLSKPEVRRKRPERVWTLVTPEPQANSPLKINPLSAPPRKLATSGRNYSRPRNNIYFYPYANGGGVCSPGYSNGSYRSWTFVRPPAATPSPSPVNTVPTR